MAQTEAQLRASKKYHAQFDDIKVRVPKGQREKWQDYAAACGQSLNTFIQCAVLKEIAEIDKNKNRR